MILAPATVRRSIPLAITRTPHRRFTNQCHRQKPAPVQSQPPAGRDNCDFEWTLLTQVVQRATDDLMALQPAPDCDAASDVREIVTTAVERAFRFAMACAAVDAAQCPDLAGLFKAKVRSKRAR